MLALIFAISAPLLSGCSRAPEKSLEELEPEEVRNERRNKHKNMVPKNP